MLRLAAALLLMIAATAPAMARPAIEHVFVVVMENSDARANKHGDNRYIYGNKKNAPYINRTLIPSAARAEQFVDELPHLDSEPHYILMEAGTNTFADTSFTCDSEPLRPCEGSATPNWTTSTDHLVTRLKAAGLTWRAYVEGYDPANTGACPASSSEFYAARHVPFVFFADVAGAPPAWDNEECASHFRDFTALAADMEKGDVPNYVFIVPNVCNDMHGKKGCKGNDIRNGDNFLKDNLPALITWGEANKGVAMVMWDEDDQQEIIPFIMAGAGVKKNYASKVRYSHRSFIRTMERIFALPGLETVKDATDFADMFEAGAFP